MLSEVLKFLFGESVGTGEFVRIFDLYGVVLLPVVIGALAILLLLPRPRRTVPVFGITAAVLSGILVPVVLSIQNASISTVESGLFWAFATLAVISGGLLVTQRNPARGAIAFAVVVLSSCGLFLLQAAPFLAAATVIIYAGAIIVTFLFVLMLSQPAGLSDANDRSREPLLAVLFGLLLVSALLLAVQVNYQPDRVGEMTALAEKSRLAAEAKSASEAEKILGLPAQDFLDNLSTSKAKDNFTKQEWAPVENFVQQWDASLALPEKLPEEYAKATKTADKFLKERISQLKAEVEGEQKKLAASKEDKERNELRTKLKGLSEQLDGYTATQGALGRLLGDLKLPDSLEDIGTALDELGRIRPKDGPTQAVYDQLALAEKSTKEAFWEKSREALPRLASAIGELTWLIGRRQPAPPPPPRPKGLEDLVRNLQDATRFTTRDAARKASFRPDKMLYDADEMVPSKPTEKSLAKPLGWEPFRDSISKLADDTDNDKLDWSKVQSRIQQTARLGQELVKDRSASPSAASGLPANTPTGQLPRDKDGITILPPPVPAANVAAVGRSLFTDYLLAVEMGGTLLLVATIGAIAITARRNEGQV